MRAEWMRAGLAGKARRGGAAWICAGMLAMAVSLLFAMRTTAKPDDTELLQTREQVWRAWFAGDVKTLERLVPSDTIVMSGGEAQWKHQAEVLRTSADFHAKGGKLLRLEFLRTEVQHFGEVAIVWSSYTLRWKWMGRNRAGRAG